MLNLLLEASALPAKLMAITIITVEVKIFQIVTSLRVGPVSKESYGFRVGASHGKSTTCLVLCQSRDIVHLKVHSQL